MRGVWELHGELNGRVVDAGESLTPKNFVPAIKRVDQDYSSYLTFCPRKDFRCKPYRLFIFGAGDRSCCSRVSRIRCKGSERY